MRRLRTRAVAFATLLMLMGAAHPMHTAVTEITQASDAAMTTICIRVFADDFGAIAMGAPGSAQADSAMSLYVRGRFAIADGSGRPVVFTWRGARPEGDVLLLTLDATIPKGLGHARVYSGLLADRFDDQINIVRATYGGRTITLLFTPGDASKALP